MDYLPYLIGFCFGVNISAAYFLWSEREAWYKLVLAALFGLPAMIIYFALIILAAVFENFMYWRSLKAIINMRRGMYDNLNDERLEMSKRLKANVEKKKGFGVTKWLDLIFINGVLKRNHKI